MRLCEDLQEDIIQQFQNVLDAYDQLMEECSAFAGICADDKDLKLEANYLYDFCRKDLNDQIKYTKEEILDKYYPIDFADDEEDYVKAGEMYRDSKDARNSIFRSKNI